MLDRDVAVLQGGVGAGRCVEARDAGATSSETLSQGLEQTTREVGQ